MTNETMTWIGWLDKVLQESNVSFENFTPFREMVRRWFQAGESYSLAALSLKIVVRERLRAIRIEEQGSKDNLGRIFIDSI